jgi:hypothetical protein
MKPQVGFMQGYILTTYPVDQADQAMPSLIPLIPLLCKPQEFEHQRG